MLSDLKWVGQPVVVQSEHKLATLKPRQIPAWLGSAKPQKQSGFAMLEVLKVSTLAILLADWRCLSGAVIARAAMGLILASRIADPSSSPLRSMTVL